MKKYYSLVFVLLLGIPCLFAQQDPVTAFLQKWENSKTYTLQVAEAMPEARYDYKPTERQMTFARQLIHIRNNMDWLGEKYLAIAAPATKEFPDRKQQTLYDLENAFNRVHAAVKALSPEALKETIDFFAGPMTKLQILNLLQDHVTHHRGQLIVYLNLNEIQPPKYTGW